MRVDDAGEQNSQTLPHCHDDDEGDRAELRDGVEDEQLTGGRADGEQHHVEVEERVSQHEVQAGDEAALLPQGHARENHREQVHAGHHLNRAHFVGAEQLPLPVGGESIEEQVT